MRKTSTMFLNSWFPAFRPGLGEKHPSKLLNFRQLLKAENYKKQKEHRHNGNAPSFIYYLKKSIRLG